MRLAWGQIPGPEATGSPGSVAGAHVLEQAVHAEGDERGESHADAHDPEHAPGDRAPVPPLGRETERDPAPGASCEREGGDPEQGGDGDRERRVDELVRVAETREEDRERQRQHRGEPGEHGTDAASATPSCHGYCLTYGRPTAAGGIDRPTTPATTTSVTTYGSARKSVVQAASSPYALG